MLELPETFVAGFHDEETVRKMRYRTLEHYGKVSVLSFGASGLGGMFTKGAGTGIKDAAEKRHHAADEDVWFMEDAAEDKAMAREIVHKALQAGVNLFDTAHWYGQGKSERMLGHAFRGVPRRAFYVNTKIGRYDKDPCKMFDFTAERVYQSVCDSLRRLQLDYIDAVQIHDPEFCPSVDILVNETLPALQRCKDEGKIRLIGMTGYPLAVQREIIARSSVAIDTSLTYCHYSLNDTSLLTGGFIDFCRSRSIALINASPISMGLLMDRAPPDWHPATAETKALCVTANEYCRSKGVNISKIALAFTLAEETIATTLVSTTNAKRLLANIEIARVGHALSAEELAAMEHMRDHIFVKDHSWEGVELAAYWPAVGKRLVTEKQYSNKRARTSPATGANLAHLACAGKKEE